MNQTCSWFREKPDADKWSEKKLVSHETSYIGYPSRINVIRPQLHGFDCLLVHPSSRTTYMPFSVRLADISLPKCQTAIIALLDHYSQHPMGSDKPLPDDVKDRLIEGLRAHPMSRVFLAYDGELAIGIVVCFIGFSTFKAKPLINIHDLAVLESYRSRGVGTQLIDAVIEFAKSLGCCAITLEVRADNQARKLYAKKGFQALGEPLASDATLFGKLML